MTTQATDVQARGAPIDRSFDDLWQKISKVDICMLTTRRADGSMRSRPMATQDRQFEDTIWFATNPGSTKVRDLEASADVLLSYSSKDHDIYVTASGRGRVVRDPAKAKEIWSPFMKAWWPDGPESPKLCLIEVKLREAEYWHNRQPKLLQFVQMAAGAATGKPAYDMGEDVKMKF